MCKVIILIVHVNISEMGNVSFSLAALVTCCGALEQNLSNNIKVDNITSSLLLIFFMMLLENAHVLRADKDAHCC